MDPVQERPTDQPDLTGIAGEQAFQLERSTEPEELEPSDPSASPAPTDASQKRRRRWGAETDAGKEVLRAASAEAEQSGEPAGKRGKKSRWDEKAEEETVSIPGLPGFTLPAHLAHLIDVDPETLDLQKQLAMVRGWGQPWHGTCESSQQRTQGCCTIGMVPML